MFKEIETTKPSDLIIKQFQEIVSLGHLAPGDRLPSPKSIAEQMKVSQSDVKEAFAKLEQHGVLKTVPQSGSYLADIGHLAIEMILTLITEMDRRDFKSLLDTRRLLEVRAAELAADAATEAELMELNGIHSRFIEGIGQGGKSVDADWHFHLKIAQFSHSSILAYLVALLMPEVARFCDTPGRIEDGRYDAVVKEHTKIYEAIAARDGNGAATAMGEHLDRVAQNRLEEWGNRQRTRHSKANGGSDGCL